MNHSAAGAAWPCPSTLPLPCHYPPCFLPPPQLVIIGVVPDTIDINVAGIEHMSDAAWHAAAAVFKRELAGVQLLTQEQVCD
jgi:hypothetical protein